MLKLLGISLFSVCAAWASGSLGTPILLRANPQMVYPNTPENIDALGRIVIDIGGANLGPPDGDHPAQMEAGYLHVFVRGLSPSMDRATPWTPATSDNGVTLLGGTSLSVMALAVDPARFLSEPGSHLQVKMWVSLGPSAALEPSQAQTQCSEWSAIKTIDVAPAGATKPVPPATPNPPVVITRIVPGDVILPAPPGGLRLKVYGQNMKSNQLSVILNGDEANAILSEDAAHYYEDDNTPIPGGLAMFHVTLPEKVVRTTPGSLRITVKNAYSTAVSREKVLTFSYPARLPAGGPHPAAPAKPVMAPLAPGIVNPVALPAALTRVVPASFRLGDRSASYRLRIYGRQVGGAGTKVIFNGDEAGAVPAEDVARNVDDDGTTLKDGERVFHVTLPEKYRRTAAGQVTVTVLQGATRTNAATVDFVAMEVRAPLVQPVNPVPKTPVPPRAPLQVPKH